VQNVTRVVLSDMRDKHNMMKFSDTVKT